MNIPFQEGEFGDNKGILRKLSNADVLSEKFCDTFLDKMKLNGKDFKYKPEILCVGKNSPLRFKVFYTEDAKIETSNWTKLDDDFLGTNPEITKEIYKKNLVDPDGDGFFVSSIGSCSGDSGGPMFLKS